MLYIPCNLKICSSLLSMQGRVVHELLLPEITSCVTYEYWLDKHIIPLQDHTHVISGRFMRRDLTPRQIDQPYCRDFCLAALQFFSNICSSEEMVTLGTRTNQIYILVPSNTPTYLSFLTSWNSSVDHHHFNVYSKS